MVGKLPVPRLATNLDYSRARAYCICSRVRVSLDSLARLDEVQEELLYYPRRRR